MTRATYTIRTQYRIHWKADGDTLETDRKYSERERREIPWITFAKPSALEPGDIFDTEQEAWDYWDASGYGFKRNSKRGECPVEVKPFKQ